MAASAALDDAKHGFSRSKMYKENLAGTLDAYDRHVFLCYKSHLSWPPRLEASDVDPLPMRVTTVWRARKNDITVKARRKKISERMKILQDLFPGFNKVIGKSLVLDEIINYIQSLQRQVEFLSMKLEVVNSRLNSGIEAFPPKDVSLKHPLLLTLNF
ncbi:Transcription factor BPE [Glycine max]|nr:Transcription factor BPE [Glycine max]